MVPGIPIVPNAVYYLVIFGWIGMPDTSEDEALACVDPFALPPDREAPVESEPAVPES